MSKPHLTPEPRLRTAIVAALAGLLFGLGLLASGMTEPSKVKGFLDLAGAWNPSLAFVMGGAIGVGLIAFARAKRQTKSWSGEPMDLPTSRVIDTPLVVGGLLFGAGWGLAGLCPGPALVTAAMGWGPAWLFVAAMLVGMVLHDEGWKRLKA